MPVFFVLLCKGLHKHPDGESGFQTRVDRKMRTIPVFDTIMENSVKRERENVNFAESTG